MPTTPPNDSGALTGQSVLGTSRPRVRETAKCAIGDTLINDRRCGGQSQHHLTAWSIRQRNATAKTAWIRS